MESPVAPRVYRERREGGVSARGRGSKRFCMQETVEVSVPLSVSREGLCLWRCGRRGGHTRAGALGPGPALVFVVRVSKPGIEGVF